MRMDSILNDQEDLIMSDGKKQESNGPLHTPVSMLGSIVPAQGEQYEGEFLSTNTGKADLFNDEFANMLAGNAMEALNPKEANILPPEMKP